VSWGMVAATVATLGLGLVLLARLLRARFDAPIAFASLALAALGTVLLDVAAHARIAPAAAFAASALALWLHARRGRPAIPRAAAVGAVAGLAAALHWPGAALVLLALPSARPRGRALLVAAAVAAAVWIGSAPGAALPGPAGEPEPWLALFGSRQGLLFLTPVVALGLAGAALDARRAPAVSAAAAALVALQALVPGPAAHREQWAALLPLLAPGLAALLHRVRGAVRRAPLVPLWAAGLALVCWNLLFMQQYASGMIPRDAPVAFSEVAQNNAALLARAVGTPSAWPANWLFAARHSVGPERFDAAAGKRLPRGPGGAVTLDVGRLDVDDALLLEGWSVRHRCGADVCRAVEGSARVLMPHQGPGETELVVRASGEGTMAVDGVARALGPAPADLVFELGRRRRGLHAMTLTVTPGARALVDRLTLRPRGPERAP
jgi:hypothetical protein